MIFLQIFTLAVFSPVSASSARARLQSKYYVCCYFHRQTFILSGRYIFWYYREAGRDLSFFQQCLTAVDSVAKLLRLKRPHRIIVKRVDCE